MTRIREGWWGMLALCVACGLWFCVMPLLGYGYFVDGVVIRPGWLGIPPCVFGAVFAARHTKLGARMAALTGVALFAVSFALGAQFWVMKASNALPCRMFGHAVSCEMVDASRQAGRTWEPTTALGHLRSPLDPGTFLENTR